MSLLFKFGAWLLSFLSSGTVGRILDTLDKKTDAQTERERTQAEVTKEVIRAEVASQQAGRDVLIAEQGRWYTAMIRPLFAAPFIIYIWKLVVWDKVLGWGVTDPLSPQLGEIMMTILGAYFIGRTAEKITSTITSRRGR